MSAARLLADLQARGVVLAPDCGRLRVDAPRGVLTPSDRQALARHKPALLAMLAVGVEPPAPAAPPDREEEAIWQVPCVDCSAILPRGYWYRCAECLAAARAETRR